MYRRLSVSSSPWLCAPCQLPAFHDSLFVGDDVLSAASWVCLPPIVSLSSTSPQCIATKNPTIWVSNARFLRNKIPELQTVMAYMPNTIFAPCGAWLEQSNHDGQLIPIGQYTVYRRDRTSSRGGGVLVAVPSSLSCHRRQESEMADLGSLSIEITIRGRRYLFGLRLLPTFPANRLLRPPPFFARARRLHGKHISQCLCPRKFQRPD